MKDLKFCPKCGQQSLKWDGEKKWNCSECDYILFHNVAGAVAVNVPSSFLLSFEFEHPEKSNPVASVQASINFERVNGINNSLCCSAWKFILDNQHSKKLPRLC